MDTAIKPCWRKPATILLASEIPVNEKAFGFDVCGRICRMGLGHTIHERAPLQRLPEFFGHSFRSTVFQKLL